MSVNVNTVYQRVLAITNKEQRGYITPQEFNYMANQAQLDIFEQYFYDSNQFARIPGNSTEYSDMLDILEEKISLFEVSKVSDTEPSGNAVNDADLIYLKSNGYFTIPSSLYRLGTVLYNNVEAEQVNKKDYLYITKSPLSKPTNDFPIYIKDDNGIKIYGASVIGAEDSTDANQDEHNPLVSYNYIKTPANVNWAYDSTTGLYDSGNSTNFELHASEETELVIKILALAGIVLKDPGLYQIGSAEEVKSVQQEKA